ncbi:MAG: sulfotransferase family 2 domain-containing protein [Porticoccaceae bacterium]
MAYSQKLNLLFIHIPKCAGTSIIEAMREVDEQVIHGHNKWSHYQDRITEGSGPQSFAIIRNPWDRAFSCYSYAIKRESYWHGKNKRWGIHPDYMLLVNRSFKDAVRILYENRHLLDLPEQKRPHFHFNWSYQYPYVYDDDGILKIKKLYRYENINEAISWLEENYGLKVRKLNTSTDGADYRREYDSEAADMIAAIYGKDVEMFDFSF